MKRQQVNIAVCCCSLNIAFEFRIKTLHCVVDLQHKMCMQHLCRKITFHFNVKAQKIFIVHMHDKKLIDFLSFVCKFQDFVEKKRFLTIVNSELLFSIFSCLSCLFYRKDKYICRSV